MNLLFLIDGMEDITAGGSERQILQLIQFVRDAGESPELCILRETRWLTEQDSGCPIMFRDISSWFSLKAIKEFFDLARWIRSRRFEAVITMFWEANMVGPVLARFAGVPLVIGSRRNLNYWMTPRVALLQRISNLFVTRLLANCHAVKDVVVRTEHVAPAKVDVLYNGIDTARFRPDPEERRRVRERFGIRGDEIVVGNVSTFRPVKGLEVFIEAASLVANQNANCRFALVGDGPERASIEEAIRRLGLTSRFLLLGSQIDVVPFLNAFDVAVLSSHSEGFSNSILEYMAVRLPCIATDVGGNAEALAQTGILVPARNPKALADAILKLAGDSKLREKLADSAWQRAQQTFALAEAGRNLREYLHRLAAK